MAYWAVARLEPRRERLALHCLGLAGFRVYLPRLRERRLSHGRRIEVRPPLFPGYCFFVVEAQWHSARWSVGICDLVRMEVVQLELIDQVFSTSSCKMRKRSVSMSRPR